jgi:hypothetical protein
VTSATLYQSTLGMHKSKGWAERWNPPLRCVQHKPLGMETSLLPRGKEGLGHTEGSQMRPTTYCTQLTTAMPSDPAPSAGDHASPAAPQLPRPPTRQPRVSPQAAGSASSTRTSSRAPPQQGTRRRSEHLGEEVPILPKQI